MPTSIFLSYAKPFNTEQETFIEHLKEHLIRNGFTPRTLGVTDYSISAPLVKIKNMMGECFGLLSIAFRRVRIENGTGKPGCKLGKQEEYHISQKWITSPYCHIEPSMAFQLDMPILILRETEVIADGILEIGVVGSYMPEFDLASPIDEYFRSLRWEQIFDEWKKAVMTHKTKTQFEADDIIKTIINYCICEGKNISSDHLYNMFNSTIDQHKKKRSGQKEDDPVGFIRQLGSYLKVDETEIQKRYKKTGRSLWTDYTDICRNFFY
jgi:hypothetical protein